MRLLQPTAPSFTSFQVPALIRHCLFPKLIESYRQAVRHQTANTDSVKTLIDNLKQSQRQSPFIRVVFWFGEERQGQPSTSEEFRALRDLLKSLVGCDPNFATITGHLDMICKTYPDQCGYDIVITSGPRTDGVLRSH